MRELYSITEADGNLFRRMLENGLAHLSENEQTVNDMNVFPVPDGDTGTNLRLTLSAGLSNAGFDSYVGKYLDSVAEGMLLGARGNSGVIVSQIFRGISLRATGCEKLNVRDFTEALICGYKAAYSSLSNPVEGTILTVAREGTEYFERRAGEISGFGEMFAVYLDGMRKSLERTPELLPKLKEAQVTDSGAYGFILIMEGMADYLSGKEYDRVSDSDNHSKSLDYSAFDSDSSFEYGYCMEFLLRLMSAKTDVMSFDYDNFVLNLRSLGESVVCVQNGTVVKVHIHVFRPAPVIELAQRFGEFLSFKLENMSLQHSEKSADRNLSEYDSAVFPVKNTEGKHWPLAVVTPVNGDGVINVIKSFPFVTVIESPDMVNTSASEFIEVCKSVDADEIVIMPNNKNVLASAKQAVSLSEKKNIEIIATENVVQCYFALAMDDSTDSLSSRFSALKENAESVRTILVAKSTKTITTDGVDCVKGNYVSYLDKKPVCCSSDISETVISALKEANDFSVCFVFTGKNFNDTEGLESAVGKLYPNIDFSIQQGNQNVYDLLIGLV